MSFTWNFYTSGRDVTPTVRKCHRGPMIDVEVTMSKEFTYMEHHEELRRKFLEVVVTTSAVEVSTRETVLRTLNTMLAPLFARIYPQKKELQVLVCEKRRCTDIELDLEGYGPRFMDAANRFNYQYKLQQQQLDVLLAALKSESPIMRGAGKAGVILLASFYEMDHNNA
jgi:hypothetical protein